MKIHHVHFIVSLSTAALSNIKPESARMSRDSYCGKRHYGRDISNSAEFSTKFTVCGGYSAAQWNTYQVQVPQHSRKYFSNDLIHVPCIVYYLI